MTPKDILIPLAILVLQIWVIKWIDVKIKFATSEADAIAAIKKVGVRLWSWVMLAIPGFFAILELIKGTVVTKLAVIYLFLFTISLAFNFSLYLAEKIISILKDFHKLNVYVHSELEANSKIIQEHNQILKELINGQKKS